MSYMSQVRVHARGHFQVVPYGGRGRDGGRERSKCDVRVGGGMSEKRVRGQMGNSE